MIETDVNGQGGTLCSPRLIRVLQNLLQNAIRHTPADGTVRMEALRRPAGLEVIVKDSGEGIAPEALDRVFEPFWRGDAARSSDGSGLGLALAKRIVESLGGEIEVQSEPARGSRFAVLLPDLGESSRSGSHPHRRDHRPALRLTSRRAEAAAAARSALAELARPRSAGVW